MSHRERERCSTSAIVASVVVSGEVISTRCVLTGSDDGTETCSTAPVRGRTRPRHADALVRRALRGVLRVDGPARRGADRLRRTRGGSRAGRVRPRPCALGPHRAATPVPAGRRRQCLPLRWTADCTRARATTRERVVAASLGVDELFDALSKLPYRNRAALVLRYYEGLSHAEIAEVLSCREGTVASLVHRGIAQLRRVIET